MSAMSPITWTRRIPGTLTESTGVLGAATETTVSGVGMLVQGRAQEYAAANLEMVNQPTMLFRSDDYPLRAFTTEFVRPGDTCSLNGLTFTARAIFPIAPDARVIMARIICSAGAN